MNLRTRHAPPAPWAPGGTFSGRLTETISIDATTYLPTSVTLTGADGRVVASQTFAWLPPTQPNLAHLTAASIPPAFTCAQNIADGPNPLCPNAKLPG